MDPVRQIADAVLYEGYLLWPYRRSALKNQRRFTFGDLAPQAPGMRTQCLLEGGDAADVEVTVRFLLEDVAHEVGPGPIAIGDVTGTVDYRSERVSDTRWRLTVDVVNTTVGSGTLSGTHTILRTPRGRFISAREPAAAGCENIGTWPVLVGDDAMLSSPIILDDNPRIAPESPGDLFDGGEIDGLLTLNILALTDEEKAEMREDPRTRAILERTESLSRDQLMRLHGYRVER
jgi:hypothetical protein